MAVTSKHFRITQDQAKELLKNSKSRYYNTHEITKPPYSLSHEKTRQFIQELRKQNYRCQTHSDNHLKSVGFEFIDETPTTRCKACGLEISDWTSQMDPLRIHKSNSPQCPFILSLCPPRIITTTNINETTKTEQPLKKLKIDTSTEFHTSFIFIEVNTLKEIRKRTFSHWARQLSPLTSQMIRAGFFGCNVSDRVVCIYCNIVCQQWDQNFDDPCQVHKTISPKCLYVITMLAEESASNSSSLTIINEVTSMTANSDALQHTTIVYTAAIHQQFIEIPKRFASFSEWSTENMPSVDDLVKAGFFYAGKDTVVTCFYCNGSLQNWGANDNPMVEHARWFPHCAYAKQLCGSELYQRIQESKRALQVRTETNNLNNGSQIHVGDVNSRGTLLIPDESTLSRLVAARLDLPNSQRLLDKKFKLSVIKRCWEDQLRLKQSDFVSDSDLLMACTILSKQIEIINGNKDNIIVPSVTMKKIREKQQTENREQTQKMPIVTVTDPVDNVSNTAILQSADSKTDANKQSDPPTLENPCVLCLTEERQLACIPCGHLVTCVPCGHSLRLCPICRRDIQAFVRVYV